MAPTLRHNPSTCHRSCYRALVVPHLHRRLTEGQEAVQQAMLARRYTEQKQVRGKEEVAEYTVAAMGVMVDAATAVGDNDDDDSNGDDQGNGDHNNDDLKLSITIAMPIDDESYMEYLHAEGRRLLVLAIERCLTDRPDIIDDVHLHPEPQPEPQFMRREYHCQEARDPEQVKRRAIWKDRQWARCSKALAAQGGVDGGRLRRHCQQDRPSSVEEAEKTERWRKIWRENQRARRQTLRAAAAAAALSVEVSSDSSHA